MLMLISKTHDMPDPWPMACPVGATEAWRICTDGRHNLWRWPGSEPGHPMGRAQQCWAAQHLEI